MKSRGVEIVFALALAACGGQTVGAGGSTAATSTSASSGSQSSTTFITIIDTTTTVGSTIVDAASCMIQASNYDQSCNVDSDCAMVSAGDYCDSNQCHCGGSAISQSALAQFNADVAKTPVGSGAVQGALCGCPAEVAPCCRQGTCQNGNAGCFSASDTLPACADAGGSCQPPYVSSCGTPGPPDACAYSDELCCLP